MSTGRLMANIKRVGGSIGSQGSEAPGSPEAQPASAKPLSAIARADRRRRAIKLPGTLDFINANPASFSGQVAGPSRKKAARAAIDSYSRTGRPQFEVYCRRG